METICKVRRSAYTKLPQDKLAFFCRNVVDRCDGNDRYTNLATVVTAVKEKLTAYESALAAAQDLGRTNVFNKNETRKLLLTEMNKLSDGLDFFAAGDKSYPLDAGMELQHKPVRHTPAKEEPKVPINVSVFSKGEVGVLEVLFDHESRHNVLAVAAEWREEGGTVWNNGNYFDGKTGKIKNLPSLSKVDVRLRSIGRYDLKSDWTTPITVPVL